MVDPIEQNARNGTVLLTLPHSDFDKKSANEGNNDYDNTIHNSIQLLQLPVGWKVQDLASAYFVAGGSGQQAVLISTVRDCNMSVHFVETSNVQVVVPPRGKGHEGTINKDDSVTSKSMCVTSGRLLQGSGAGSGSRFLELRSRTVTVAMLQEVCESFSPWDPLQSSLTPTWQTIERIAAALQCSRKELQRLFLSCHEFYIPSDSDEYFCRISQECLHTCYEAVLATLTEEADAFGDYDSIDVTALVRGAMHRLGATLASAQIYDVLRHCVHTMADHHKAQSTANSRLCIDPSKVAIQVAHQIFARQLLWEYDSFMAQWQRDMPVLAFQVDVSLLAGIAVRVHEKNDILLKYLPRERLPPAVPACLAAMFQTKEEWTAKELAPYLERLASTPSEQSTLLAQYTIAVMSNDGLDQKVYRSRN